MSALVPRIELPGLDGEQARQALVLLLAVCQHEASLEPYLATLPSIAITALPRLFRALPARLSPDAPVASPAMDALIRHINFYALLTKAALSVCACTQPRYKVSYANSTVYDYQDLRQKFFRVFDDDFVLAILGPALLQPYFTSTS